MLGIAFEAVLERHLERVLPADLALWSLNGLEVIDPQLHPELREGTLSLSGPGGVLAVRPMPVPVPNAPAAGLAAALLTALMEAGWNASPALREAGAEALLKSAFEELFNHLDPYSRYVTPAEARAARTRRIGAVGLGLRFAARGDAVLVGALEPDGPAARSGLRVGDRVLEIEDLRVTARDLENATALLSGPEDSELAVLVQRGRRRFPVTLRRSVLPPASVQAERRDEVLWLRVYGFSAATDRQLALALAEGSRPGPPRAVVLDLRGNRGGLLDQAVAVASTFLSAGLVAQTTGRHPDARRSFIAVPPDYTAGARLVVLVDGRTASAAEIVAAALLDRGRAALVGSATQGKGLIQVVIPLPDGGELLLSWSRILAPRGWPLQGLGVLPTVCTSHGPEALATSLARLSQGESPMAPALLRLRAERAPVPATEVAALRAACPPAEGGEADLAVARLLAGNPAAYAAALGR